MQHTSTALFHEEQHLVRNWIILVVFPLTFLSVLPILYGSFQQLVNDKPYGNAPVSDLAVILINVATFGILGGVFGLLAYAKLDTDIERDTLQVKYRPFHRKTQVYNWSEVQSAEVRQYRPIMEYGGWGLRGWGKNRALNAYGNMGLQLVFKDGKKLLIGTQKADELATLLFSLGVGLGA
jgi:hypothetical protein